jgi:hypothetical protein
MRNGKVERFSVEAPQFFQGVNIRDKQRHAGGFGYTGQQETARKNFAADQFKAKFGIFPEGVTSSGSDSGSDSASGSATKSTAQSSASVDKKRRTSNPVSKRRASGGTAGSSVTNLGSVTQKKTLLGE